ncbi:CRISPR-associated endonuclease Cas2 [Saccharolobus islandicus]|uniref:CRISPR-associated endonuclease Cas2 n=1 Tax=Saccharolobus islandicus TaxID=43080 RepID=UPI00280B9365|nr:CRISPR-associated endonuclease Cas2 [Sulfolobus islandicus]
MSFDVSRKFFNLYKYNGYMYVVVSYDISDEKVRGKVRRLLRRYGLSFISRSTYAGRISWNRVNFISEKVSRIIKEGDIVAFIPVQNVDFSRTLIVSKNKVSGYEIQVIFAGKDI